MNLHENPSNLSQIFACFGGEISGSIARNILSVNRQSITAEKNLLMKFKDIYESGSESEADGYISKTIFLLAPFIGGQSVNYFYWFFTIISH